MPTQDAGDGGEGLLGRLAIREGGVAPDSLVECLAEQAGALAQGRERRPLGRLLVEKGYLTEDGLARLLEAKRALFLSPVPLGEARQEDARFGELLLAHGLAGPEQVSEALRLQDRLHDHAIDLRLGELLVRRGLLSETQVRDVLALQDKTVLCCPACAKAWNVVAYERGRSVPCPGCGASLVVAENGGALRVAGSSPSLSLPGATIVEASPPAPAPSPARAERAGGLDVDVLSGPPTLPSAAPAPPGPPPTAATLPLLRIGSAARPTAAAGTHAVGLSPATEPTGTPFGRYLLVKELGRGGMGVVHKAWDTDLKRIVALKTLLPDSATEDGVRRFLVEARSAARLRHPGIVQVHDVGSVDGRHFFTMDYIEGETLESARRKLPPRRFLEILRQATLALHAAHEAGVVHRDVKPANILLDAAGRSYVGDFGLAKEVRDEGKGMTLSGVVMGTPQYMSPEQANAETSRICPASDVWSLGVILYEHLAGRLPFRGDNLGQLLVALLQGDPVPPSRVEAASGARRRVHRDLETICLKCIEKEPFRRYGRAQELADDLGRFLDGEPILARPPTLVYRAARFGRKHRLALGVAAAGLVALVLVSVADALAQNRLRQAAAESARRAEELHRREEVRLRARAELGAALQSRGAERQAHLDAAIAADPDALEARLLRAETRWHEGRLVDALADADRAVESEPAEPAARVLRFRLLRFGFLDEEAAAADLLPLAGAAEAGPALLLLAYREAASGRPAQATEAFERATRVNPRHPRPWVGYARCRLAAGDAEAALDACAHAAETEPDCPETETLTVQALLALCRYEEAAERAGRLLARLPSAVEAALVALESAHLSKNKDTAASALDGSTAAFRALAAAAADASSARAARLTGPGTEAKLREDWLRARVYLAAGRASEARAAMQRAATAAADPGARGFLTGVERTALHVLSARVARLEGKREDEERELAAAAAEGEVSAPAEQGARLSADGRVTEAALAFERALAPPPPDSIEARFLALAAPCVAALERDPPDARREPARFVEVERPLRRVLEANPRSVPALLGLATARRMAADVAAARKLLDAAVEANPRSPEARLARARFLRDVRDFRDLDAAEADLLEVGRLAKGRLAGEAALDLGAVQLRRARPEEALAAAEHALAERADWARAHKLRADALSKLGRAEEARKALSAWMQAAQDDEAGARAYGIGVVYHRMAKYDNAIDFYTRAIESCPRQARFYDSRGDLLIKTGRYGEGFRDKAETVRQDPAREFEIFAQCVTARRTDPLTAQVAGTAMLDGARRYAGEAAGAFLEALHHLVFGKYEAAYTRFAQVLELDPGFSAANTFQALAALRTGRRAEAEAALARAEKLAPDHKLLILFRAAFLASGGDLEGAGHALEAAARLGAVHEYVLEELKELAPLRDDPRYRALRAEK
ncbi:MAG: protein kinase [Planctomycetes bacterium]|nr:protein kinase [Planctomycetota bacterium]